MLEQIIHIFASKLYAVQEINVAELFHPSGY